VKRRRGEREKAAAAGSGERKQKRRKMKKKSFFLPQKKMTATAVSATQAETPQASPSRPPLPSPLPAGVVVEDGLLKVERKKREKRKEKRVEEEKEEEDRKTPLLLFPCSSPCPFKCVDLSLFSLFLSFSLSPFSPLFFQNTDRASSVGLGPGSSGARPLGQGTRITR